MLKPFYQGKLDSFCAIYAVLNGLRLTHSIRVGKARDILNETLLMLSANTEQFRLFLTQQTDYIMLVDIMLAMQKKALPLEVIKPYTEESRPSPQEVWKSLVDWLPRDETANSGRAVVFRFLRHVDPRQAPLNRHWTTADHTRPEILHLFDCSHEAEAILNIRKDSFVTSPGQVDADHLLYIQPESMRFLRLPF